MSEEQRPKPDLGVPDILKGRMSISEQQITNIVMEERVARGSPPGVSVLEDPELSTVGGLVHLLEHWSYPTPDLPVSVVILQGEDLISYDIVDVSNDYTINGRLTITLEVEKTAAPEIEEEQDG